MRSQSRCQTTVYYSISNILHGYIGMEHGTWDMLRQGGGRPPRCVIVICEQVVEAYTTQDQGMRAKKGRKNCSAGCGTAGLQLGYVSSRYLVNTYYNNELIYHRTALLAVDVSRIPTITMR